MGRRDWRAAAAKAERQEEARRRRQNNRAFNRNRGGTFDSTSFRDVPQRSDSSVTNTYFNSGSQDSDNHGHVKYHENPDGTTDYLYARDVEGNEYDV